MVFELNRTMILRRFTAPAVLAALCIYYGIIVGLSAIKFKVDLSNFALAAVAGISFGWFLVCQRARRRFYISLDRVRLTMEGLFTTSTIALHDVVKYQHLPSWVTKEVIGLMLVTGRGKKTVISIDMFVRRSDFVTLLAELTAALREQTGAASYPNRHAGQPYVSLALCSVYVALHFGIEYFWGSRFEEVLRLGAATREFWLAAEFYRPVSAAFLHTGTHHLLINVCCFLMLANLIESILRRSEFLIIFLLSAVFSIAFSSAVFGYEAVVGASGAICAIFGAYLCIKRNAPARISALFEISNRTMVFIAATEIASGIFLKNVATGCHFFGFLLGYFLTFIFVIVPERKGTAKARRTGGLEVGLVVMACLYGVAKFLIIAASSPQ